MSEKSWKRCEGKGEEGIHSGGFENLCTAYRLSWRSFIRRMVAVKCSSPVHLRGGVGCRGRIGDTWPAMDRVIREYCVSYSR